MRRSVSLLKGCQAGPKVVPSTSSPTGIFRSGRGSEKEHNGEAVGLQDSLNGVRKQP